MKERFRRASEDLRRIINLIGNEEGKTNQVVLSVKEASLVFRIPEATLKRMSEELGELYIRGKGKGGEIVISYRREVPSYRELRNLLL
ncbi:MAG: hypothetical protein ACPLKP_03805 [Microgenomates group bacterium]